MDTNFTKMNNQHCQNHQSNVITNLELISFMISTNRPSIKQVTKKINLVII